MGRVASTLSFFAARADKTIARAPEPKALPIWPIKTLGLRNGFAEPLTPQKIPLKRGLYFIFFCDFMLTTKKIKRRYGAHVQSSLRLSCTEISATCQKRGFRFILVASLTYTHKRRSKLDGVPGALSAVYLRVHPNASSDFLSGHGLEPAMIRALAQRRLLQL